MISSRSCFTPRPYFTLLRSSSTLTSGNSSSMVTAFILVRIDFDWYYSGLFIHFTLPTPAISGFTDTDNKKRLDKFRAVCYSFTYETALLT